MRRRDLRRTVSSRAINTCRKCGFIIEETTHSENAEVRMQEDLDYITEWLSHGAGLGLTAENVPGHHEEFGEYRWR